jgi:CHAT domain/CATRA-Associated Small Protein
MINPRQLNRAGAALRIVRRLELDPDQWDTVAELVHELLLAVHARDELRLRKALAELEQAGDVRAGGLTWKGREVPTLFESELVSSAPPAELLTRLDELAAELTIAAAEIRRVPHIDIDEPLPLHPGTRFTACVRLDTTPSRDDEQATAFVLRNPPADLQKLSIDVWLTGTAHFVIEGQATATIEVRPAEPRSTEARFALAVRDPLPADAGTPALRATFDYQLRASGSVRRKVPITTADGDRSRNDLGEPESGGVLVHGRAMPPDLEVVIKRDPGQAQRYLVLLRTGLLGGDCVTGRWTLPERAEDMVQRIMVDFADAAATPVGRQRSLQGAGLAFFEAAPECFQQLYWRMVDAGTPPGSIYLVSDEPAIPWELMIPRRRESGQPWQTMPPLGVSCAIGRWHQAEHFSPSQSLPLSDSLVLAPDYPGERKLPHASAERDLVLTRFPGHEVPGTFDELDTFYATHSASLLHFVCHGLDSTLQAILLLRHQTLSAQQARSGGLAQACQLRHPLVFLNACELGRPGLGLARVEGFPASFIAGDAGAVIAPLWAVDDSVAHQVAVDFYQALRDDPNRPFADVLRLIRARAYEAGGADSFAAYCFYGDPLAATERP